MTFDFSSTTNPQPSCLSHAPALLDKAGACRQLLSLPGPTHHLIPTLTLNPPQKATRLPCIALHQHLHAAALSSSSMPFAVDVHSAELGLASCRAGEACAAGALAGITAAGAEAATSSPAMLAQLAGEACAAGTTAGIAAAEGQASRAAMAAGLPRPLPNMLKQGRQHERKPKTTHLELARA